MSRRKDTGIWQAPNGMWGVDYRTPDGHRHKYLVGPKQLAKDQYHQKKNEIIEGRYRPKPAPRMTFAELAEEGLASKRGRVAESSYRSDSQRIRNVQASLGSLLIETITPREIDQFLQQIRDGRTGATVNRYRSLLSSLFSYAVRNGLLLANPVARVPSYKESENRDRYLELEEEAVLRQVFREDCPEQEPEFDLALHTGIRRGEQWNLRWQNVDLERKILTVRIGKTGRREIELNGQCRAALEYLHSRSRGSAFVTPESTGTGRDWRHWFEDAIERAGIENFTWHDLRHTFASRAVMRGVDLTTVQRWLGHKSILMTMRYAHLAPNHRQEQIEKLVDILPTYGKRMDTGKDTLPFVTDIKTAQAV